MISFLQLAGISLLAVLFFLCESQAADSAMKAQTATVRAIRGTVQVSTNGVTWREIKISQNLPEGAWIRSKEESSADLFPAGNRAVLRITEHTTVRLASLGITESPTNPKTKTVIELVAGKIFGNVTRMSADSDYLILTKSNLIQIRRGDYGVCETGKFAMFSGEASASMNGKHVAVASGELFVPATANIRRIKWEDQRSAEPSHKKILSPLISPGFRQYLVGESFRRMQDGWPPLVVEDLPACDGSNIIDLTFELDCSDHS